MTSDATGVPLYKGDSTGYIVHDTYCSYQMGRSILEYLALRQPEHKEHYAAEARALNHLHLRQLLKKQPKVWAEGEKPWVWTQPRAARRFLEHFLP